MTRSVEELAFLLTLNGLPDSPPASGMRDWLVKRGARVAMAVHPLGLKDGDSSHFLLRYANGELIGEREVRLPSHPPLTFPLDLLWPLRLPEADVVIAFNNMHAARALASKRALSSRRDRTVIYSAVDFVPDRFGPGSRMTRLYERLDRLACEASDLRLEVSQIARESRETSLGLGPDAAPAHVTPIGAWLERVPTVSDDGHGRRRVVFIGHLVERMGIDTLIDAIAHLRAAGVDVYADIAGHGPLEEPLRERARAAGIDQAITWHGFISDHQVLEELLASATIAVAPYSTRVESFTRFADPSKLKSYLGAGLPILVTDVPPNAHEIAERGGAEVVEDSSEAFAAAIRRLLDDEATWRHRRAAALEYVRQFDWGVIMADTFAQLDIV